jgi:tetratricopeptide (TPR) repeat protein/DNA-binding SARP family transcriptional activator
MISISRFRAKPERIDYLRGKGLSFAEGFLVEFRVLGPVELWAGGREQDLGSVKERCVLAVLLIADGRSISVETLIDRVWGEDPPARDTLYPHIARLRGRLRRISGENLLVSRSGSYTLKISRDAVDLHRFRSLVTRARAAVGGDDDEQALRLFNEAEALWLGQPLAGLSGGWVTRTRDKLEAERLGATLDRVAAQLRIGQHAGLVGELAELTSVHPLNETLIEHQMLALYRSGRQSDALQIYRNAHRRLDHELGIEPGPRLQELHQRMLERDPELAAPAAEHRITLDSGPNTLPRDVPGFTGRAEELRTLLDVVTSDAAGTAVDVEAIDGMPGVGKTALAVHAAHQLADHFPDGKFYLHLHAHDFTQGPVDPADGLETLLRLLGVSAGQIPAKLDERAAMWRAWTTNRHALILLDDAAGREQIQPLLPGSPGCLVLITSRRRLAGLHGARTHSIDVLPEQDAATLFTRIVGAGRAADAAAVAEIVRLCGHLPLAVEIVASRLRHRPAWSLTDLATRLARTQHRLAEFHAEDLMVASAFELSYRELTGAQRHAFRCLGLHLGADFTPPAAAALIGADLADTERALEDLVACHLLEEPHSGRFRMHDLLREYARDRAVHDEPGLERVRVHRLLDYYLHTADVADRTLHPNRRRRDIAIAHPPTAMPVFDNVGAAQRWISAEHANLLASIKHAAGHQWPMHTAQLPHVLADILETSGHWQDAAAAHRHALDAWREIGDPNGEAQALGDLSFAQYRTGNYDAALRHAHDALSIYRDVGDQRGEADILDRIGLVNWHAARYRDGLTCFQEALVIRRDIGDRQGQIDAISHSGIVYWHIGRYREAISNFEEALAICQDIGDRRRAAKMLNNIGDVQQHLGRHRDAIELYQQTLEIFQEIGGSQNIAILYNNIGNVYRHKGLYDKALEYYRKALAVYRDTGDLRNQADALNNIGLTYHHAEQYKEALSKYKNALSIAREINELYEQARAHLGLGDGYREIVRYPTALDHYRTALDLAHDLGAPYEEAQSLNGIGETLLHLRGETAAKAYWQQALALFQQIDVPEAESVRIRLQTLSTPRAANS